MSKTKNKEYLTGWMKRYLMLKNLFLSAYEFENLPETVNERYLNKILLEGGRACFYFDEGMGLVALNPVNYGTLDVYGEPLKLRCIGENGQQRSEILTNHENCVIMYHNEVRDIPQALLQDYAKRIYKIERTIDINVHNQKTPYFIATTPENKLTMQQILRETDDYEASVLINNSLDPQKTFAILTPAPYVADQLMQLKRDYYNEVLAYIGIDSNMAEKTERLVAGEVLVSNGLSIANRTSMLMSRQRALDEINNMFGTNIKVYATNPSLLDSFTQETGGGLVE